MDNVVLWVDEIQNPEEETWKTYKEEHFTGEPKTVWVKTYEEFMDYIDKTPQFPRYISLDDKIGGECLEYFKKIHRLYNCHNFPDFDCHAQDSGEVESLIKTLVCG